MQNNGMYKVVDGEVMVSTAMLLCMALDAMHAPDVTGDGRENANSIVRELLALAREHQFKRSDILLTLAASGYDKPRVASLCRQAMCDIPQDEVFAALRRAGFTPILPN